MIPVGTRRWISADELVRRTDLEEETVRDVLRILAEEFEEEK